MTNMKRITISLHPEQETAILELRKTDKYCRMSFAKIIRLMLDEGLRLSSDGEAKPKEG